MSTIGTESDLANLSRGYTKGSFIETLVSFSIAFALFTSWIGLQYSLLLFFCLLVHEAGHIVLLLHYRVPIRSFIFLPIGAIIASSPAATREQNVAIAFGGPLAGTLLGVVAFALWTYLPERQPALIMTVYICALLNLLNLFPIGSLDGGRVLGGVSPYFHFLGVVLISPLIVLRGDCILALVALYMVSGSGIKPCYQYILGGALMVQMIFAAIMNPGAWWLSLPCLWLGYIRTRANYQGMMEAEFRKKFILHIRSHKCGSLPPKIQHPRFRARLLPKKKRLGWMMRWSVLALALGYMLASSAPEAVPLLKVLLPK